MPDANKAPYDEKTRRKSLWTVAMVGGLFVLAILVFGIMFGAGEFLAGS